MKTIIGISLLLLLNACSKTDVHLAAQNPPVQDSSVRLVEIDKALAQPPTGEPQDANRRAQLRAERDSLTGASRIVSVQNAVTQNTAAPGSRTAPMPQQQTRIVVAGDSQSSLNNRWSGYESLTPSEKKDYLKMMRATNSNQVIVTDHH